MKVRHSENSMSGTPLRSTTTASGERHRGPWRRMSPAPSSWKRGGAGGTFDSTEIRSGPGSWLWQTMRCGMLNDQFGDNSGLSQSCLHRRLLRTLRMRLINESMMSEQWGQSLRGSTRSASRTGRSSHCAIGHNSRMPRQRQRSASRSGRFGPACRGHANSYASSLTMPKLIRMEGIERH